MRGFGLIGYPLSHSFSEKYFTQKFTREGRSDCRYQLFPLASIHELPALLEANPGLEGLNVTIPYKKEILAFLDDRSQLPVGLEACNCIRIRNKQLTGFNTDWSGFANSLRPLLKAHHQKALVLGNGGATAAVVYALEQLGIAHSIVSRKIHGGSSFTYASLDKKILEEHLLVINTTPLGMHPHTGTCPDIPYTFIGPHHLLYDLVYNPTRTLFLQKGEEQGAAIKNGEEMLVLQAEESWKIWNS